MLALTPGRRAPRRTDVVRDATDLDRALGEAVAIGRATLYEAVREEDGGEPEGWVFARLEVFSGPATKDRDKLGEEVGRSALEAPEVRYMRGDCWSLAAVASEILGRPVALFVTDAHRDDGEPDHVAVDLGDGRYLDMRGVLTADEVAFGLNEGARPEPETVDAHGLAAVFDRFHGQEGYALADTLEADGWGDSTRTLFRLFLEAAALEAMGHDLPSPTR